MDWIKLHEMEDLISIRDIIRKEGTRDENRAFNCAIGLDKLGMPTTVMLFAGMNIDKLDDIDNVIPDTFTKMTQYLFNALDSKQLNLLEHIIIASLVYKDD